MYPFRIRITDPFEIDMLKKVCKYRVVKTTPNLTKSIGHKIPRSIKRDGISIQNGIVAITNPKIDITSKPSYGKKKGYDFTIKTIF